MCKCCLIQSNTILCYVMLLLLYALFSTHTYRIQGKLLMGVYLFLCVFFVILDCMWRFYLEFVFRCKRLLAYSPKVMYSKKDYITDVIVIKNGFCRFKDRHMCALKIKRLNPLLYLFIVSIAWKCLWNVNIKLTSVVSVILGLLRYINTSHCRTVTLQQQADVL